MNKSSMKTARISSNRLFYITGLLILVLASGVTTALAGQQTSPLFLADKGQQYDWGEDGWRDVEKRKGEQKKPKKSKNKKQKSDSKQRSRKERYQESPNNYRNSRQDDSSERRVYQQRGNSPPAQSNREQNSYTRESSGRGSRTGRSEEYSQNVRPQTSRPANTTEHRGSRQVRGDTLDSAVSRIRQQTGGKILSAETVRRDDGGREHRIRVFTEDGRVKRYRIRAD